MSDQEERGFNDSELADIMNEIESLEEEFATEAKEKGSKVVEPIEGNTPDAEEETPSTPIAVKEEAPIAPQEVDDVAHKLESMPATPEPTQSDEEPVSSAAPINDETEANVVNLPKKQPTRTPKHSRSPQGINEVDFTLAANGQMKVNFIVGEKTITVYFDAENELSIDLNGNGTFSLPLSESASHKRRVG